VNLIKAGLVQVIWCTAAAVAGSLLLHLVYHVHVQGLRWWEPDPGIVCVLVGWFTGLRYCTYQLKALRDQGYAQWKQDVIDATRRTGEVQQ